MLSHRAGVALCTLLLAVPAALQAQDTRAEVLARQRAEKATRLHEYEPGRLEKLLLYVEDRDPLGRLAPRNGFFVRYGYHEKPVGSGIGVGGGYRHDLFSHNARLVLEGGETFRNYHLLRGDFSLPWLADDRLEVGVEGTYRHHPQEDFYGIGPTAPEDDRVSFRLNTTAVLGRGLLRPAPWLELGGHAGLISPSVGTGTDSRFPSIEDRFDAVTAPGLASQPDFGYRDVVAAVDYRDQPGNARSGGYYSVGWAQYRDRDRGTYDFDRLDVRAQQFFPIFDEKRVFAVQARVVTSHTDAGSEVPFYFQPTLGGSTTLRSVADYRFRDDNVLHLNAEYRWEAFSGLDMALFTDWGKVTADPGDLDFDNLQRAYGLGFRFNTYKEVFLRVDIGGGAGEGLHYHIKFSKAY